MRALTVRQPYASGIVKGDKQVENRTQQTHVRGRITIHAGAQIHERFRGWSNPLPMASILGTVQLVDCHNSETCAKGACHGRRGAEYSLNGVVWHWVFTEPREFVTPIPRVKGALGFWRPTDSDAYLVDHAEVVL